jgi:hypothetical protein
MSNSLIRIGARILSDARELLCRAAAWIARQLSRVWATHRDLILSNGSYAAAFASTAASIAGQTNPRDLITAIVTGLLAMYAAKQRRPQRRDRGFDEPYEVWDPI